MNRSAMALAAACGALLATSAPAAAATTRYVSPTGLNSAACTVAAPCDFAKVTSLLGAGDTVVVKSGIYATATGFTVNQPNVDVVGESGAARPTIQLDGPVATIAYGPTAAGSKLRGVKVTQPTGGIIGIGAMSAAAPITVDDVEIQASGGCLSLSGSGSALTNSTLAQTPALGAPFSCLSTNGAATVDNVRVSIGAGGFGNPAAQLNGPGQTINRLTVEGAGGVVLGQPGTTAVGTPSTIRRSRISTTSPVMGTLGTVPLSLYQPVVVSDTLAVAGPATAPMPGLVMPAVAAGSDVKLRNVTAIAAGTGSTGLAVQPQPVAPTVSVKSSILRGETAAKDIVITPGAPSVLKSIPGICTIPTMPGCQDTLTGVLTVSHSNFRGTTGTLAAASGSNQANDPQFTDAPGGNFKPQSGSPAIDNGTDDADNGSTDLDGIARKQGAAPDIGAYELAVPPDPGPQQPTSPGGTTEPVISAPVTDTVAPALSRLGITNKSFAVGSESTPLNAARAKKGTTFVLSLSEPATTTISFERPATGRRKGSSCVKPTRKNRKGKKCTRYAEVGTLTRAGIQGANAVPFSGRIGKRALKPGSYRASVVAIDNAGNRSAVRSIGFKVVRK